VPIWWCIVGCGKNGCPELRCILLGSDKTYHALEYTPSRPCWIRLSSCRMKVPGFANKGVYLVTSLMYSHMIPSPRVGSGVEVRQTTSQIWMSLSNSLERGKPSLLSTFWKVKIPSLSNWVPLEVTVKLRVMAAQDPGGPQSVGGLHLVVNHRCRNLRTKLNSYSSWTTSALPCDFVSAYLT